MSAGFFVRLPTLEQHEVDLIGLFLVAVGVFLACVLYLGWDGGKAGAGLADGVRFVVGTMAYAMPIGLVAAGALIVFRPLLPAGRPFGIGGLLLLAGMTLAFAAGTFGLGPDGARADLWTHDFVAPRGGVLGEALYSAAHPAIQALGAHILATFLILGGALLVTGASIASVVAGTRDLARGTALRLRETRAHFDEAIAAHRHHGAVAPADEPPPIVPPEPAGREPVIHATHVEVPSLDAEDRFPDLFGPTENAAAEPVFDQGDEDEPVEAGADEAEASNEEPPSGRDEGQLTPQGRYRDAVIDDPHFEWKLPSRGALKRTKGEARPDTSGQERTATLLVETLGHFGVEAKLAGTVTGPHITRFELRLAPGTKMSKMAQLKDELAYELAATEVRILAPIPGKQAVGVEVPNARRRIVHLGDVFQDPPADWSPLTVWLGKDVSGQAIGADLSKLAHLLVAGTTGSGKSGCVNAMLSSILLRATPQDVRMVLVDPKQVELNHYESIPHLLTPVITNPRTAANALGNLVREMEERYSTMSLARSRNLAELNRTRESKGEQRLPYILCVIDELADLMMVAPGEVEDCVIRLAQKARAVGIHLVLATQSPRVDVITGMIKANVPSRIAFAVSSQTDSRVILDQNGAESLLGQGDMLFSPIGSSKLQRIQGAYIDEDQIAKLTDHWRRQGEPEFREELLEEVEREDSEPERDDGFSPDEDALLGEAIALVAQMGTASTSMLQRRLRLGYTRAGRLIDMLERRGVISGYEGSKPRQVLITEGDVPRVLAALEAGGEPAPAAVGGPGDEQD